MVRGMIKLIDRFGQTFWVDLFQQIAAMLQKHPETCEQNYDTSLHFHFGGNEICLNMPDQKRYLFDHDSSVNNHDP